MKLRQKWMIGKMATSEQKQELVDTIKGPKFYRISLYGYGGEAAYLNLTKEQYDFWKPHLEEHGDNDIVNYAVGAEDGEFDFEVLEQVPESAQFLLNKEENYSSPWYEAPGEFSHQWGASYDNALVTIEEIDSDEYNAPVINEVVDGEDLSSYIESINEEHDTDVLTMDCEDDYGGDFVLQFYSAEKGSFFDGIIETIGPFDPTKLHIYTSEYPNGEDIVTGIHYNGAEVENQGGDTNGKGYSVYIWSNK